MRLKVYAYKNCETCRRALKFLDRQGIAYDAVPMRDTPPTKKELKLMLAHMNGNTRKLFNTSGVEYAKLELKDKLDDLSDAEVITLLSSNGNLVKRPFVLYADGGLLGFNEPIWRDALVE